MLGTPFNGLYAPQRLCASGAYGESTWRRASQGVLKLRYSAGVIIRGDCLVVVNFIPATREYFFGFSKKVTERDILAQRTLSRRKAFFLGGGGMDE